MKSTLATDCSLAAGGSSAAARSSSFAGVTSARTGIAHELRGILAALVVLAIPVPATWGGERSPIRIACLGDSNTFALPGMTPDGWCELLTAQMGAARWATRSFAYLGATVTGAATASFATAADHVARAEAVWQPDIYLLSYGTNDIKSRSPAEIVAAYEGYRNGLIAKGRRVLVATTPQLASPASPSPAIVELNALLRRRIPAQDLLDFDTISAPSDYDRDGVRVNQRDGIHINLAGQTKRARAARAALAGP